ncbi:MAG: hypothetical protein Q4D86_00935 [Pasteurella oralis]|nr:hypothetical protein [Pasteurella oralis]MDO5053862.1 hypothetical protein [Pasteurella oralis]
MFKYRVKDYSNEKIDVIFQVGSVSLAIMLVEKMEIAQRIK